MHDARPQTPAPRLTEVRLHGHLRARFGRSYRFAVGSAGEAVRALCATVPGFRQYMAQHSVPGYRVWMGDAPAASVADLRNPAGGLVRIVPVVAGAKSGIGQVLFGGALIVAGMYMPEIALFNVGKTAYTLGGLAFNLGVSLVLGGVGQMLAGTPQSPGASSAERADNKPSYTFNGAVNTVGQGNAVPVLYGRLRVGSQVVSTGLSSAALA